MSAFWTGFLISFGSGLLMICVVIIVVAKAARRSKVAGKSGEGEPEPASESQPKNPPNWHGLLEEAKSEGMVAALKMRERGTRVTVTTELDNAIQGIHEHAYDLGAADERERTRLALIEEANIKSRHDDDYFIQGVHMKSGASAVLDPETQRMLILARSEALRKFASSRPFDTSLPDGSVFALLARGAAAEREKNRLTALMTADALSGEGKEAFLDFARSLEKRDGDPELDAVTRCWESAFVRLQARCNSQELRIEALKAELKTASGAGS